MRPMNKQQLQRWKKVSIGLAKNAYPSMTPARRKRLIAEIKEFIATVTYNFDLDQIEDWDGNRGECYVCDELSDFLWNNRYEFERERKGWTDVVQGKFGNTLSCCIRAGFDMAVAPSAGVIGYTAGDLRRIFDGRLPGWITARFGDPSALVLAGDHEGVWL